MQTVTLTIINEEGMHLRPAQALADAASGYDSDIYLQTADGQEANVKSVLNLIALGLEKGAQVTLATEGEDEEQALSELAKLFEQGFGE
ncbi:HPr family phosphocarrier protein [Paenibacillus puerhi]|uniref:HPr family phosphocarrier protein n=1 Tax=Paenibacillus puerhi TaxID=2692622 RepID=UPI0013596D41|nr:HPr family phosphocarrier protein [Paenibacillus puerhi]